ncbi:RnfABCDGE type electron transport complex subunit D [Tahibacter caeni]|uniref:RnfABCDGE type electron transport complex subunit D n=1 Tax=Tahibacter caeni TaxID=1453545 RepID=UPI00214930C3|nr:RnfABCDGE type electron transport complex subunit D [Tahibacter caeni]
MKTFATAGAPHLPAPVAVRRVMHDVLLALLPGIAVQLWAFGTGVAIQIALAVVSALAIEAAALRLRGRDVARALGDGSALVTAVLFALCIAPLAPWWMSPVAMLVAIGLVKQVYGGLGSNLFNPAMAGYAVVLLAFPRLVAQWPATALDPAAAARTIFGATAATTWDSLASATPLDALRQLAAQGQRLPEIGAAALFRQSRPEVWAWAAGAWLLGGFWLLWRRVIGWQATTGVLATVLALTLPFWLLDAERHPSPLQHLAGGGLMFAAWFVVTDPVSGCTSPRGRLLFGAGVAVLTLAIRRWGNIPDGIAFAVLLMNAAAPLLDRVTRPRIYGHGRHG